ncbi:hypothetical protein MAPG_04369 [Magnaporthiopsis poae ATCC 64411]|uniref:Cytochrome b561 domain-containing protein n=1 Tax=Magnaporthiopsis poae (strain ATCC 64411 / 73-15) TaxID=644358 RepID=A0A0C4DWI8_MAGP6|nr:hypothetical protein MAPG_04369 [Magnaporthiopsis poae ATCC 64411]
MSSPAAPEPTADRESEPLLGRPGAALQKPNEPLYSNLYRGTGGFALAGAVLLLALVWSAVFTHPLLPLFSPHPLLQSLGVFTLTQAILILQPTFDPKAKVVGARTHATLNLISFLLFASGVAIIEANKFKSHNPHFKSLHAYLGVGVSVLMLGQYIFGFLMWGVPGVFGGVDQAKAMWKYHRWGGYFIYPLLLATVATATDTTYNQKVLDIKLWAVILSVVLIVIGVYPRIHVRKLGIRR